MDWDKLRIFHAIAKAGSFTKGGEALNLSQSALSRHIANLENKIGLTLFHRHARGLVLTEQGEILFKAADQIAQQLATIKGELDDSEDAAAGSLVITASEFIGSTWMAPRLASLKEQFPKLNLTFLFDDRLFNLGMREADAAVRFHKTDQPSLVQHKLAQVHFHMCASKGYKKKHGEPKTVKELKDHTLIGFPNNVRTMFSNPGLLFRMAGIVPEENSNAVVINSMYGIRRAVEGGLGIGMLPLYLIDGDDDIDVVLPDHKDESIDLYYAYPEERANSERIKIFHDFLKDAVSKTPF